MLRDDETPAAPPGRPGSDGWPGESGQPDEPDGDAVLRFVERFALILYESGVPRMPARVFAALFASSSGLSAAELADRLQISPASVSGAVRYLVQVRMVQRDREPGARRDHFRLPEEVWPYLVGSQGHLLERWVNTMRDGLPAVAGDSVVHTRVQETVDFFDFFARELPMMIKRWEAHQEDLRAARRVAEPPSSPPAAVPTPSP